jgi:CDP-diacylglycerol--glycerol-3-phosphate 3-phosphatidyltransferase
MSSLNLPNTLTISRLLAVPFCCYALFKNGGDDWVWQIIAWTGFFLVGLTDFLDGRIARSRQQITSFGTFLDPVADKVAIGAAKNTAEVNGGVKLLPRMGCVFVSSRSGTQSSRHLLTNVN